MLRWATFLSRNLSRPAGSLIIALVLARSLIITLSGSRFPRRIVNRLTRDTADVDRQLPNNLGMALRSFLQLLSIIMLMGWAAPLALPPMVVIMLGFSMLFLYYQVREGRRAYGFRIV